MPYADFFIWIIKRQNIGYVLTLLFVNTIEKEKRPEPVPCNGNLLEFDSLVYHSIDGLVSP